MLIEVLCEDRSSLPVLEKLLGDALQEHPYAHEMRLRPHRGVGTLPSDLEAEPVPNKTGLYDLLPAKLRAYESLATVATIIIVAVHDADDRDPAAAYQNLEFLFRRFSPSHFFIIGIAVEEIEAWLLGDFPAIQAAYPWADRKRWLHYKQDSVCGTWEKLAYIVEGTQKAQELIRVGYPAVGIYKAEWALRIAPHLLAARNNSPSLQEFLSRFHHILRIAEEQLHGT